MFASRRVARRTARRTTRRVARRQETFAPQATYDEPSQQPAPTAEPDYVGELQQLAELKSQGLITEAEYEAKKKQILGI